MKRYRFLTAFLDFHFCVFAGVVAPECVMGIKQKPLSFLSKFSLGLSLLTLMVSGPSFAAALQLERLELERLKTLSLIHQLDLDPVYGLSHNGEAELSLQVASYRRGSGLPPFLLLRDAPFFGFLLQSQTEAIYAAAYEGAFQEQYRKYVENPDLELILDQFLEAYLEGVLPSDLAQTADRLGFCLSEKVLRGKSSDCTLDRSEQVHPPGALRLALAKLSCILPVPTACDVRRWLYDEMKPDLIEAKKTRALEKPFMAVFPKRFREEFLITLANQKEHFSDLLAKKFSAASPGVLDWTTLPLIEQMAAVEIDEQVPVRKVTLSSFAQGLRADVGAARWLPNRSDAALLFFAAANRLLMLTGGSQARWAEDHFVLSSQSLFDPAQPKKAPLFDAVPFGGWALGKVQQTLGFSPWDWSKYNPASSPREESTRLFPSELLLTSTGVPLTNGSDLGTVEKTEDLAELLWALSDFLKATRQGGVLAQHFGSAQNLGALLDPTRPVVFPQEGRLLAMGIVAGVLKNLTWPEGGHIEAVDPFTPEGGLGLRFHDAITLNGRVVGPASTRSLSALLFSIAQLRRSLEGDADVPADLVALLPKLDQAVQVGALTLVAQGQAPNGDFTETLTLSPQTEASGGWKTGIPGVRALTQAYARSETLVLKLSLIAGWESLERLRVHASQEVRLDEGLRLQLLDLWVETEAYGVRRALNSSVNWLVWETFLKEKR